MLHEFLPLQPGSVVALVGAGGKTTTMYRLAAELAGRGQRVITTTTTRIYPPSAEQTDAFIIEPVRALLMAKVQEALKAHQRVTLATSSTSEGKLRGLPQEWIAELQQHAPLCAILVEADGARGKLLKAPGDHEPVIPQRANLVLLLASVSAIGQPLNDAIAHRTERVAAITGLHPGERITPSAIAMLATDERGLLKGIPPNAAAVLLLTHVDTHSLDDAEEVARLALASGSISRVVCCSLDWATAYP